MSHSLVQQGDNLRRQLAAQKSECVALRSECETWKDRANEESRKVAMLEDQLENSEKDVIKWRARFNELLARGPSGSLERKRNRTGHEDGRDDNYVDTDVVLVSEGSRGSVARPSESVGDKYDQMAWADVQASIDAAESPETHSENPAKEEEEEVSALILDPIRGERPYQYEDEVECLPNGAFPTTFANVDPPAFSLPSDIVLARFRRANAQSLGITPSPRFHAKAVTRRFLSSKYGGNPYTAQCHIAETTRRQKGHNISAYFCPNVKWSPCLPRSPGLPGLFNFPSPGLEIPEMPMFVGLNVHEWVYMGHYVGVPQEPLSQEEIESLGEKTLSTWVEDMVKNKKWANIRARVYLRLQGMVPTDEAVERILNSRVLQQVSATDIRAAFERREEAMHVVYLKPVRYDRNFQKEIIDGFRKHEQELKMKTKQAIKKGVAGAISADQPMRQGKRSRKSSDYPKRVPSAVTAPNAANTKIRTNRAVQNDPIENNWELRRPKRARHHSPEV